MTLRTRLALVVALFISAFIAGCTLLMLVEVPERANAETRGALPWITDLLPNQVDTSVAGGTGGALERLARQVRSMHTLRHAQVILKTPDGEVVSVTPRRPSELPRGVYHVKDLKAVWTCSTGVLNGHERGPLVVGGIMYVHTPDSNIT